MCWSTENGKMLFCFSKKGRLKIETININTVEFRQKMEKAGNLQPVSFLDLMTFSVFIIIFSLRLPSYYAYYDDAYVYFI